MPRILAISGSLRRGSYNAALLNAAAALVEEGTELEIGSIRGIREDVRVDHARQKPCRCS